MLLYRYVQLHPYGIIPVNHLVVKLELRHRASRVLLNSWGLIKRLSNVKKLRSVFHPFDKKLQSFRVLVDLLDTGSASIRCEVRSPIRPQISSDSSTGSHFLVFVVHPSMEAASAHSSATYHNAISNCSAAVEGA